VEAHQERAGFRGPAQPRIPRVTPGDDSRHRREGLHIVHRGRAAQIAVSGWVRWAGADRRAQPGQGPSGAAATVSHLRAVGNPAPPRPRNPEAATSRSTRPRPPRPAATPATRCHREAGPARRAPLRGSAVPEHARW
jgi:hypothetical protein